MTRWTRNSKKLITNSNMAQMLLIQTNSIKEINQKLDKYIEKNEVEHKKFDYEISNLNVKLKFAR